MNTLISIKQCDFEIKTKADALKLDGVGKGIADRIDEYLKTGGIEELNEELSSENKLLTELQEIHGVGPAGAKKYISMGIKSVDDLKMKVNNGLKCVHSVFVGLKYYDDFKKKIPYDEVHDIFTKTNNVICKLIPNTIVECCGSHRRKKSMSGDIDILITHQNLNIKNELNKIISELIKEGILIDHLTEFKNGDKKYMGVCIHPIVKIGRRIDIIILDYVNYYYALLYFTGSAWLNKEMRKVAISKNFTLNEYSLTDNFTHEQYIVHSEKEIFDKLEIVYLTPEERDIV